MGNMMLPLWIFVILACELSHVFGLNAKPGINKEIEHGQFKTLNGTKKNMGQDQTSLHEEDLMKQKHNSSFVGFTAWKQSVQTYVAGDIVEFEGLLLNEGNHFQPNFNWFVCPSNGIYFVAVSFRGTNYDEIRLEVVLESTQILYGFNWVGYNPFNTVSNSGITRCNQGERIWVQATGTGSVYGEPGIPHTTFSVFMMNEGGSEDQLHQSFSGATAWSDEIQNYISGDIIYFQQTLFNEGENFLPELSRFICPEGGTYLVALNARKYEGFPLEIGIVKNTLTMLQIDDTFEENNDNVLSNCGLIKCSQGESISVQATGIGSVEGRSFDPPTTFSVMLMQSEGTTNNKHQSFVGFTAWKKALQNYQIGDTIVFDGIILNEGGHFQLPLSRFVCPTNGIYFVAVTCKKLVVTDGSVSDLIVDVEHATNTIFRLEDLQLENPGNTIGNSVLIRCFTGEEIIVRGAGVGAVYGDASKTMSTFTVMLMFEY